MGAGDGVAIEECEELAESIKEGPVGEHTDTLVGVDGAWGCGGAVSGAAGGRPRTAGGGGFMWIRAQETQLGALLISQTLQREGLVELNGSTVDLKQGTELLDTQISICRCITYSNCMN